MRSDLPEGAIDLGADHWFTWFSYSEDHHPEAPEKAGIIEWHLNPDGELCGGAVNFWRPPGDKGPTWQVHSLDPLHVEPSVLCSPEKGGCGSHGFIRGGRWVTA